MTQSDRRTRPAGDGFFGSIFSARRAFLSIESNERALAFVSTPLGVTLIHGVFLALAVVSGQLSAASVTYIAAMLTALAIFPARRWSIIGAAGALYFVLRPFRTGEKADFVHDTAFSAAFMADLEPLLPQAGLAALFLALVFAALKVQRRWPKSLPSRRPLVTLLFLLAALIALGLQLDPGSHRFALIWTFALFLSSSLFFLAYLFVGQKNAADVTDGMRLGFVRPFWGGPGVPFKGPSFLARFEAHTEDALAMTRLKALKLMLWAVILAVCGQALHAVFYGVAELPTLHALILSHAGGSEPSRVIGLAALAKNFILTIIAVGAMGHVLVAVVRMSGFSIPRNMARPLSARSVAEFWNRYVYYFKEVLVDFFFYPAFARFFKGNTKLRIAFATFSAAFFGNVLFSVVAQANLCAEVGPLGVARHFESYAFYAFLLAVALIVSQLRKSRPKPEDGWWRYDVVPRAGVISLFAFLLIFADESGTIRLADRLDFALWLLFIA